MRLLQDILIDANSTLDLEAALPTSDELVLRANYANQAVWDAAATGQFKEFKKIYEVNTSTLASIPMPIDFRELQINPMVLDASGEWQEYEEIKAEERYGKNASDRYCYVLGVPRAYTLVFNSIISMAILSVVYQRFPSGLLTLTDICELPDPSYVTRKIESYVLYSRGDDRFPIAQAVEQQVLLNMTGREMKSAGGQAGLTQKSFKNPLR